MHAYLLTPDNSQNCTANILEKKNLSYATYVLLNLSSYSSGSSERTLPHELLHIAYLHCKVVANNYTLKYFWQFKSKCMVQQFICTFMLRVAH